MTIATDDVGRDQNYCGGRKRDGSGHLCTLPAGWGTDHVGAGRCKLHAGSTPTVAAAGHRQLAEQKARKSLAEQGVREISDPIAELWRLCEEAIALKDFFAGHVAVLEDRMRFTDDKGGEQLRSEVALYERAMDRAEKFLSNWTRLGMEERLVRVTELQAAALGAALDHALVTAGLTQEQKDICRAEVAAWLRKGGG